MVRSDCALARDARLVGGAPVADADLADFLLLAGAFLVAGFFLGADLAAAGALAAGALVAVALVAVALAAGVVAAFLVGEAVFVFAAMRHIVGTVHQPPKSFALGRNRGLRQGKKPGMD